MSAEFEERSAEGIAGPAALNRNDLFLAGLLFAFAFWTQRWVLALPLTAIDTIPTLAAASVDSWGETFSVLFRELRGGASENYYYRPLTLLSYTIDQRIWGGSPFGYHLTDVLLHSLAGVAVYAMARMAFDMPRIAGGVAAVLFLIHPAVIEVVPAITRRQEPLLVIGSCLALVGARRVPRRIGWLLLVLGSSIAVTSVERGLAIPILCASYLFLYRFSGLGRTQRLLHSLRWTIPSLLVAVAFFALRWILFGSGGTWLRARHFVEVPTRFGLSLLYPQQFFDLIVPKSGLQLGLFLALALALFVAFGVPIYKSRRRELLWSALAWNASFVLLLCFAGIVNAWYVYTGVPGLALIVLYYGLEAREQWTMPGGNRLVGALAGAAALFATAAFSVSSPLWHDYPGWRVAADLSERFLDELERVSAEIPADESILVINMPAHFRESASDNLVTASAAILWPSSIEIWNRERGSAQRITMLGSADIVGTFAIPEVEFTETGARIYFVEGDCSYTNSDGAWPGARRLPLDVGRGFEFPWQSDRSARDWQHVLIFDGTRLIPYAN